MSGELMYDKYLHNRTAYAFVEVEKAFLDSPAPEDGEWSYEPTGETNELDEPVMRLKSLKEILAESMMIDKGETVIINLSAIQAATWRWRRCDVDDLKQWDEFLSPLGYGEGSWLTLDEWRAIRQEQEEDV